MNIARCVCVCVCVFQCLKRDFFSLFQVFTTHERNMLHQTNNVSYRKSLIYMFVSAIRISALIVLIVVCWYYILLHDLWWIALYLCVYIGVPFKLT